MKLKIEGKLKDGFFEWLLKNRKLDGMNYHYSYLIQFDRIPQSAQFGLLQEYADTLGYRIETQHFQMVKGDFHLWFDLEVSDGFKSRPEAQIAAIEKLNEIVNKDGTR